MSSNTSQNRWAIAALTISNEGRAPFVVQIQGRKLWALEALIKAGAKGCTPINNPAPRWSGYVHELREMGVSIRTIHEAHAGPFAGTHARYVLQSVVTRLDASQVAA